MKIITIITLAIIISLVPCINTYGEITDKAIETAEPQDEIVAVSRGAVSVDINEPIWESEAAVLDKYYVPWADKWITLDEFKLICITTACEGGCRWEYKERLTLIAKAIINRYASGDFGETIRDVIYSDGQFNVTEWYGFPGAYADRVTDAVEVACFEAIASDFVPHDMYYFNSVGYFSWAVGYWDDGVMYFSRRREINEV